MLALSRQVKQRANRIVSIIKYLFIRGKGGIITE